MPTISKEVKEALEQRGYIGPIKVTPLGLFLSRYWQELEGVSIIIHYSAPETDKHTVRIRNVPGRQCVHTATSELEALIQCVCDLIPAQQVLTH